MAITNLRKELSTLDEVDHANIVRIIQLFNSPKLIFIMMEHIDEGSLKEVIVKNGGFKPEICRQIIKQILSALEYLHETKKIAHRDLKPENVLVDKFIVGHSIQIKLVNFGLTSEITKQEGESFVTKETTSHYLAPELLHD